MCYNRYPPHVDSNILYSTLLLALLFGCVVYASATQITFQGFLCDGFNVHRIRYDYRFIVIMGLNFFNDKFSIKSTFLKVTGCRGPENDVHTRAARLRLMLFSKDIGAF